MLSVVPPAASMMFLMLMNACAICLLGSSDTPGSLGSRPLMTDGNIMFPIFTQTGMGFSPCLGAFPTLTTSRLTMVTPFRLDHEEILILPLITLVLFYDFD